MIMEPGVLPVTPNDASIISQLAGRIWRQHYAGIISMRQIDYMLRQRYRTEVIAGQLSQPDIGWRKLILGGRIIGFSCCISIMQESALKIDKLYIHGDHRRKGYGARLIADAVAALRKQRLQSLFLTVNKRNHTAIAAYRRYGFEITGESVVDIGGGFFMDDYLMTLTHFHRWNDKA